MDGLKIKTEKEKSLDDLAIGPASLRNGFPMSTVVQN